MRVLPCGREALLLELADEAERRALVAALAATPLAGVAETVPAAVTVQLLLDGTRTPADVAEAALALPLRSDGDVALGPEVVLPVRYDGPDLAEVARLLGIGTDDVVARHTGQRWTCDFLGFLPGFGYLSGEHADLSVPRRPSPRPRVPAGSVGLAGPRTAVYPATSPGGWQLIGMCEVPLWEVHRDPPALLSPGTRVRFEAVG